MFTCLTGACNLQLIAGSCFSRLLRVLGGVLMGALMALLLGGCSEPEPPQGKPIKTRQLGKVLQDSASVGVLQSSRGSVAFDELKDKLLLVSFGYTHCPDICPTNLAVNGQVLNQLDPAQRARIRVIMVSVDPARDTPEHLKGYLAFFHPDILGLWIDEPGLASLSKAFGAIYIRQDKDKTNNGAYSIDHSAQTFVINGSGLLVQQLSFGASQEEVLSTVQKYL
jgi:protein SCO1/2